MKATQNHLDGPQLLSCAALKHSIQRFWRSRLPLSNDSDGENFMKHPSQAQKQFSEAASG